MGAQRQREEIRGRIERHAAGRELDEALAAVADGLDEEQRAALWLSGWHYARHEDAPAPPERVFEFLAGSDRGAGWGG